MRTRSVTAAIVAVVLAAAAAAGAARAQDAGDGLLWATVNVCDTAAQPDTIGIRGSMPGDGRTGDRLWMRFAVQFRAQDGTWTDLPGASASEWQQVGRGSADSRQAGRSFQVRPGADGTRLRGLVRFEWRRGSRVVRRAVRATSRGHRSTAGADPAGYSRAVCVVRP
jgi:hypothetical protein